MRTWHIRRSPGIAERGREAVSRRRPRILLVAAGAALTIAAAPATENEQAHLEEQWRICTTFDRTPDEERRNACTTVLNAPGLSPQIEALALFIRGDLLQAEGKHHLALSDFNAAAELMPDNHQIRLLRAHLLFDLHDYAAAIKDWDKIIELDPETYDIYLIRGNLYDYVGDPAAALADYGQALDLAPDDTARAEVLKERGSAYQSRHDWDNALRDLDEALRIDPDHERALYHRGQVNYLRGEAVAAATDFRRASDLNPDNNYYLLWLFLAQARNGEDAAATLRRRLPGGDREAWPGPILPVFLGDKTAQDLTPDGIDDWNRRGQLCEISFFLGQLALVNGEPDLARTRFRAAIDTGITEYIEYHAARWELKTLAP